MSASTLVMFQTWGAQEQLIQGSMSPNLQSHQSLDISLTLYICSSMLYSVDCCIQQ